MIWVCPDPPYYRGGQSQTWCCAYTFFLDLQVTRPRKREKERGASNTGNFSNKNKHNISPMIILLPPISLTFSTASESLNLSYPTVTHHLHFQHRNAIAGPPPSAMKYASIKIRHNCSFCFIDAVDSKKRYFLA